VTPADHRSVDILIVDDNDDDVLLAKTALEGAAGLSLLHVAKDGAEALEFLRRTGRYANARRPGLVLLDVNMPGMSGFEVLEKMKADPALRAIPVVVLTVSCSEDEIEQAYSVGAASFVRKPVGLEHFRAVIKGLARYWTGVAWVPG